MPHLRRATGMPPLRQTRATGRTMRRGARGGASWACAAAAHVLQAGSPPRTLFLLARAEPHGKAHGLSGGVLGVRAGAAPVLQAAGVEVGRGELADGGVHAVLHAQHAAGAPGRLQPLEQAALQRQLARARAQHRRRQLLRVAHQHGPARGARACRTTI